MSTVAQVFGPGGLMSKRFPGYEPRAGQIEYAQAVFDSVTGGTRLLTEGPTGTGKSVGYLVPVIHQIITGAADIHAWRKTVDEAAITAAGFDVGDVAPSRVLNDGEKPRALIVTANIALQEQLMQKDIPTLQALLPEHFTAAIAKGKGNYLCLDRFDDSATAMLMAPIPDAGDRRKWNAIAEWKSTTKTGDFSELPFEISGQLRQMVATSSDDCTGKACARYIDCHAEAARKRFREADVVVTNYHLFFAHLAIAAETGQGCLPRFDLVVFDEAHAMADIAREFFGFTIREGSFKWATRFLGPKSARAKGSSVGYDLDPEMRDEIINRASDLFSELRKHKSSPQYRARLVDTFPGSWPELVNKLRRAADLMDKTVQLSDMRGDMPVQRKAELRKASRRCRLLASNLSIGLDPLQDKDDKWVFFLEDEPRQNVSLRAKPIDVADALRDRVFEQKAFRSVIITSATLATNTGPDGFDYVVKEIGCDSADELIVASPFDFSKQAILIVPENAPDTKAKDFSEQVGRIAAEVVALANGRTLGLFTSHRGVKAAADAIRRMHGDRFPLFVQGDMPRTQLISAFREDIDSVLLGTRSMWAGVDVSGESLSAVLIDKLPFDPPDDPIVDAKSIDRGSFMNYSVPRAAIELRQAFGRGVRSTKDRVAVVICDRRLVDKGYGKKIKAALPRAPFSSRIEDVATYLNKGGDR